MSFTNLIPYFKRLCVHSTVKTTFRPVSTNQSLFFKASPLLMAEPLKKRKKMDPAIVRAREERRKKRLEKQIRRLEKNSRQLKQLEECDVPLSLLDEKLERQRGITISDVVLEKRALLEKKWANYKREQKLADLQMIDRIIFSQQKALDELKKESEELYQEAIQFDFHLIPFKTVGPVENPPIEDYNTPDGDYQDISKKWV